MLKSDSWIIDISLTTSQTTGNLSFKKNYYDHVLTLSILCKTPPFLVGERVKNVRGESVSSREELEKAKR